mgnify:CR=1 FL=1
MVSPRRTVARFLRASLQSAVRAAVKKEISENLRWAGSTYRTWYNRQVVGGKVFEQTVANLVPNYDPGTGQISDRADPEWTPYVGDYDFDRSEMPAVREAIRAELLAQLNGLYGEPVGMSSAFRWDTTTEERFFFADSEYDVRRAKELIVARPRVVEQLDVSSIAGFASRVLGMNPSQDAVDLRFPVLVALTRRGTPIPIDGWNRIRKSIATGSVTVPAVFLNARESKLVRVQ